MEFGRIYFDSWDGDMFPGNGIQGSATITGMEQTSKRRPFFCTAEELMFDDEYYEDPLPEKKRRLTAEQVNLLERSFEEENKLEPERKTQLARKLGLQPRQVAVWFQNHRARWKTKQLERDYDQLKCSYDSLLSNYDALLNENSTLKAEVLSLKHEPAGNSAGGDGPPCVKVEDRLSTGSDGSAILDDHCPQLLDSGDSYNECDDYVAHIDGVITEYDNFPDVEFGAAEPVGWDLLPLVSLPSNN